MTLWQKLVQTFPFTSALYWTVVVYLLVLCIVLIVVGETLALLGLKNWTFFTYYIRFLAPRHVLIASTLAFIGLAVFLGIHFIGGHGWKGRNGLSGQ